MNLIPRLFFISQVTLLEYISLQIWFVSYRGICYIKRKYPWQISSQKVVLSKYASDNGFTNPVFFIDGGVSVVTFDRPNFNCMRQSYRRDLETLKGEAIKVIRGGSSFSKELLNSLIAEAEAKCRELQGNLEAAKEAYGEGQAVMASLNTQNNDIIPWAEMYDTASIEAKKMIMSCLIKRVEVYRDYKLHMDFNIDFAQFCEGLDIVTIAA